MARTPCIGGAVQEHHKSSLQGARNVMPNVCQYLAGALEATDRDDHRAAHETALALSLTIARLHDEAQARLATQYHEDPTQFHRARIGAVAWADETAIEPVCTCNRPCPVHADEPTATFGESECSCWYGCEHRIDDSPDGDS